MLINFQTTAVASLGLVMILAACSKSEPAPKAEEDRPPVPSTHADWEDPRLTFDALDTDDDGEIDHLELREVFDILDQNDDGVIEADEDAHLVIDADLNKDGVVDAAEFDQLDLTKLNADLNGDGRISREEYDIYKNERLLGLNSGVAQNRDRVNIDPAAQFSIFRF